MFPQANSEKKYWAFISYSSKDTKWGQWLHRRLESYPIPQDFQGTELFDGAVLGKNLRPIFRDRDELSGSSDLGPSIRKALEESRYLVVLCSRNSAKSEWVNKEIEDFKGLGGEKRILALILEGVPNATRLDDEDDDEECFPPALRYPSEPLAGDLRKEGDGKERGFLKILAGAAQLDFDSLYRRHERMQRKKRLVLSALASAVILALAGLSFFAMTQRREADRQRKVAELNESIAKKNEILAVKNGEIAEEQKQIAESREEGAKVALSNKLLEQGLEFLSEGKTEEGLATLRNSLEVRPENGYARDRLLFELSHRSWFVVEGLSELPFRLLCKEVDGLDKRHGVSTRMQMSPESGGGIKLQESVRIYDTETYDLRSFVERRSVMSSDGRWTVGKKETRKETEYTDYDIELELPDGRRLVAEPTESAFGSWPIQVLGDNGNARFYGNSHDGRVAVTPHGIPVLSPDGKSILVVGLRSASFGDEPEYGSGEELEFTTYSSDDLMETGDVSIAISIAPDGELYRVWWQGDFVGVHTRQVNRSFDRLDIIDLSGQEPEHVVINKAVNSEFWCLSGDKLHILRESSSSGGEGWVVESLRINEMREWHPGEEDYFVDDFVWFADQHKLSEAAEIFEPSGDWGGWKREFLGDAVMGFPDGSEFSAALDNEGNVEISNRIGGGPLHVPLEKVSGEGGRQIIDLGISPEGKYVVVRGFSVGGDVMDWEMIGAEVGLSVFPAVYPRRRSDWIELADFFHKSNTYGLGALAYSKDRKYLALGIEGGSDKGWRKDYISELSAVDQRNGALVRVGFSNNPVPKWFLPVVDQLLGFRILVNGQIDRVPRKPGFIKQVAEKYPQTDYGLWINHFLGSN